MRTGHSATDCVMKPLALSVLEAARSLGIGRTTMYELLNDGAISSVKIGRRTLVPITELEKLLNQ